VTADGQRLSRLYSELDLVAAECIRRGVWDGLNPAELAACVSVLSFESRKQSDDAEPARLPGGPVRDVLTAMGRTWAELDQLERRNGLSFLREPDSGFVWAAYRWVRGAKLEDVLDSVPGLTPGDFVRSVKQLIDLLDQIAAAASYDASKKSSRSRTRPVRAEDSAASSAPAPEPASAAPPPPATEDASAGSPPPITEDAPPGQSVRREPSPSAPADADGDAVQEPRRREPAPRDRDVAATARAAIDAMRRGVIAYTTLTD
jgi:DSHCT (NUC185) domain